MSGQHRRSLGTPHFATREIQTGLTTEECHLISDLYRTSTGGAPPLRIGLFLDGVQLSHIFRRVIEDIQSSNFCRIEFLVLHQKPEEAATPRASLPARLVRLLSDRPRRQGLLFKVYSQQDEKRNSGIVNPAALVDCGDLLQTVESMSVTPIVKGFTHRFSPEDVARVKDRKLDVILRFGFNILRGDVLKTAKYGVWSFHHGDNDHYRGGPAHFWELVEGNPLSGVILQVLTEELDAGHVLCKSLFATKQGVSHLRNRGGPYWGSAHMVLRKLHELHQHGWEHLKEVAVPTSPYQGLRKIYRKPTNADMVRWLVPEIAARLIKRPLQRKEVYHWRVGVRANGQRLVSAGAPLTATPDMSGFEWLESPRGHFWADPFLLEHNGQAWLFFEDFIYKEKRGVIRCAPLDGEGRIGEVRTCLDTTGHLSYPHVFHHDGEIFMIPESAKSGRVELYRASQFPGEWKLEKVLFQGSIVDTTTWFDGKLWWFSACFSEPPGHVAFNALFYAESLTGTWRYHPANPISSDVRTARNAGNVIRSGGRLYRPSQDCSGGYGRGFALHEIMELTPERYRERRVVAVGPDQLPGFVGTHTYNGSGRFEVIDAVRYEAAAKFL